MKKRALSRILFAAVAMAFVGAAAEPPPDYFASLRLPTSVQDDTSYVVREETSPPDAPPLFRLRHLLLRLSQPEIPVRWGPRRNLLLVTFPSGSRYVSEITFAPVDWWHRGEPLPWVRLASSRGVVETWNMTGIPEGLEDGAPGGDPLLKDPASPCSGRHRMLGGGISTDFSLEDLSTKTVRAAIGDIREAAFSPDEIRELRQLSRLRLEAKVDAVDTLGARIGWGTILMGTPRFQSSERTLVLGRDPRPSPDLTPWRALTYLPMDVRPFAESTEERVP